MKISDTKPFLKNKKPPILPIPPFLWEKSELPPSLSPYFFENFENSTCSRVPSAVALSL